MPSLGSTGRLASSQQTSSHAIHSKWEEPLSHPHLTLYDQHRPPHCLDQNESTRQITLKLKEDLSEFRCGVCMGWIKNTVVIMGCLHRFCASCMEESLRSRNYFCPKCRKALPSKRNLRPDPRYDMLIASILGDLEDLEAKEEVEMEKIQQQLGDVAPRRKRRLRSGDEGSGASEHHQGKPGYQHRKLSGSRFVKPSKKVEFILLRHPRETRVERLTKPDLIVPGDMTIADIQQFLSQKLLHEPKDDFEILIPKDETETTLDERLTMSEIERRVASSSDEVFVLQYRLPAEQIDRTGQAQPHDRRRN